MSAMPSDALVKLLAQRLRSSEPNLGLLDLLASVVGENQNNQIFKSYKNVLVEVLKNLIYNPHGANATAQAPLHEVVVKVVCTYKQLSLLHPIFQEVLCSLREALQGGLFVDDEDEDNKNVAVELIEPTVSFHSSILEPALDEYVREIHDHDPVKVRLFKQTLPKLSVQQLRANVLVTLNFASVLLFHLEQDKSFQLDCGEDMVDKQLKSTLHLLTLYSLAYTAIHDEKIVRLALRVTRRSLGILVHTNILENNWTLEPRVTSNADNIDVACWTQIQNLLSSEHKRKTQSRRADNAFFLWLAWISFDIQSQPRQMALKKPEYWSILQVGLRHGSTERRKTCLQILMTSFTRIQGSISNSFLIWTEADVSARIVIWRKYITLAEMLFLDNSLIQIKAAVDDLVYLMDRGEEYGIAASWITTLLTLGFNSKASGIARFLCEMVLDLNKRSLRWVLDDILDEQKNPGSSFLIGTFIPFTIKSPHLAARQSSSGFCEFGEKIVLFLIKIFNYSLNSQTLSSSLLEFVSNAPGLSQTSGRLFLLKGLVQGLDGKRILTWKHAKTISKISRLRFVSTLQRDLNGIYCLRLMQFLSIPIDLKELHGYFAVLLNMVDENPHLISLLEAKKLLEFAGGDLAKDLLFDTVKDIFGNSIATDIPHLERLVSLLIAISVASSGEISTETHHRIEMDISTNTVWLESTAQAYFDILRAMSKYELTFVHEILRLPIFSELCLKLICAFPSCPSLAVQGSQLAGIIRCIPLDGPTPADKNRIIRQQFVKSWSSVEEMDFESLKWTAGDNEMFDLLQANLAICSACVAALDGEIQFTDDDAAMMASGVLLLMNQCIPKMVKHMRVFHRILEESFSLLQGCLESRGVVSERLGSTCLQAFRSSIPALDYDGLGKMLSCFHIILENCPASLTTVSDLGGFLMELADAVEETKTSSGINSPYTKCVKAVFHPTIFSASVSIGPQLAKICKDIQKYSVHRRCLGPALAKALCDAFDSAPDSFCREHELTEVLIEFLIPTLPATKDPDFILEITFSKYLGDLLEQSSGCYEKYYGEPENFAELRIFDLLTRFNFDDAIQDMFGKTIFDEIFEPWTKITEEDRLRIIHKWKKPEQLQAVLLLERFMTEDDCEEYLETLSLALKLEGSPTFRFLLEWLACRCMLKFEDLQETIWKPLHDFENTAPAFVVSLLKVGHMVARSLEDPTAKKAYFNKLVLAAIPYATCSKMSVRHAGATLIPVLYEDAKALGYTEIASNVLFQSLYTYTCSSPYRKAQGSAQAEMFDPVKNYSLVGILGGAYLGKDEGTEIRNIFTEEDFILLGVEQMKRYVPIALLETNLASKTQTLDAIVVEDEDVVMGGTGKLAKVRDSQAPLQTKGGEWDMKKFLDRSDHLDGRLTNRRQHHEIIVIASLVDNPVNLGGISRVCELSGVHELYMTDTFKTLLSKEFKSVSLASELWLPIHELKAGDIGSFIEARRFEGYTIIGIEQTDRSVILGAADCKIPKKTVLLIGREHDGVPAELLAEMDVCVEIKQFGETRSMNVQTATAVVLYEYVRQNSNL